jgi:hypothetical protein
MSSDIKKQIAVTAAVNSNEFCSGEVCPKRLSWEKICRKNQKTWRVTNIVSSALLFASSLLLVLAAFRLM